MRFTMALVAVLGAAACKKTNETAESGSGSGSGSAMPRADAAPPPPPPIDAAPPPVDAAAGPWKVPVGARAADVNADATALGAAVTVHFVERVQTRKEGGGRSVKTVLVLEGAGGAIAADETEEGSAQDAAKATMAIVGEADIVLAPLSPPRPFAEQDAHQPLDFPGPLLFLVHFKSKGERRDLAVAQDKDTLAIWTNIAASDSIDVAPSWEQTGTIKLAPGAKVTAPAPEPRP